MKENLTELTELMNCLGYEDERSVKKWCRINKVPILKMGLKKYILSYFLTQLIENQLFIFAKANSLDPKILLEQANMKSGMQTTEEEKPVQTKPEITKKFLKHPNAD